MARLERLINLVAALLEAERPLTADDLRSLVPGYAAERGSFRRAFERDKEALRELGVPVTTEVVDATDPSIVGYRIRKDDYYLSDPGLDHDELAALRLAASAVRLDGADGVQALWKLGGEVMEEGPGPPVASLPGAAHLVVLFAAISARRRVGFDYRGRRRSLEPHRLSFRSGHWYLLARQPDEEAARWYRLDRIASDVTAAGDPGAFDRPADAVATPAPPWELGGGEAVEARLLVDASQAAWATSQLGRDAVEEWRPDGSVILRVKVTNRDAFRSFVLGFLDHAEVIGPAEVRADMVDWLAALCR
ncbi:MAG: helix-turn-helix transcriptional regulator [Acidimicrobiales bacterium]